MIRIMEKLGMNQILILIVIPIFTDEWCDCECHCKTRPIAIRIT